MMNVLRVLCAVSFLLTINSSIAGSASPRWVSVDWEDELGNGLSVRLTKGGDELLRVQTFRFKSEGNWWRLCKEVADRIIDPYLNETGLRYDVGGTDIGGKQNVVRAKYFEVPITGYIDGQGKSIVDFDEEYSLLIWSSDDGQIEAGVFSEAKRSFVEKFVNAGC